MTITIYGSGCAKCRETEALVRRVVAELGVAVEVEKVEDIRAMVMAGILSTPAVAVDGVMKIAGRMPRPDEVKSWITGEHRPHRKGTIP
jgi:small redox-active disulfide protein 2